MIKDYIGKPFDELDCYALVRAIYKSEYNIEVPNHNIRHDESLKIYHRFAYEISKNWKQCQAKKGAVVAIRYNFNHPNIVTHFGYCIDDKRFIHTLKETGAIVENLSKYKNLIEGFYIWKQ